MTITFFSNFLNHHQLPLCQEFIKQVGEDNFHFVACERIHEERVKMGYEDMNVKFPFVVRAYESDEQMLKATQLAHDSDVAIVGSAPLIFQEIRAKNDKVTFLFRERLFKNGSWHRFIPTTARTIYRNYTRFRSKKFFILCASAYTADDVTLCGFPRKKCLKWGYFPETLPAAKKSFEKLRIMWCGRMLWWKHPEDAIEVARLLRDREIDFEMKMVGNGEKRALIEQLIDQHDLRPRIQTFDFMNPAEIRVEMRKSNVYLFTSGRQEGWGVVLNEALNSGCVVIANKHAGSTPYLIEDRKNGFIYDGSHNSLQHAVSLLLETPQARISQNALSTITSTWNAEKAVQHLLQFVSSGFLALATGPCSLA